jgi:hypothetical protein
MKNSLCVYLFVNELSVSSFGFQPPVFLVLQCMVSPINTADSIKDVRLNQGYGDSAA